MSGVADFDFEFLRPDLEKAVPKAEVSDDYDRVLLFKLVKVQEDFELTDEHVAAVLLRARRRTASLPSLLGLTSSKDLPDARTILRFRAALNTATLDGLPALEVLDSRVRQARRFADHTDERILELLERASMSGLLDRGKKSSDPTVREELNDELEHMDVGELRWFIRLLLADKKTGRPSKAARDWKISIEYHLALGIEKLALLRGTGGFETQGGARRPGNTSAATIARLAAEYGCDEKTIETAIRNGDRIDRERKGQVQLAI